MIVRIRGTNFRTQPQNTTQTFERTVSVSIGGMLCDAATCFDPTLITVLVPDLSPGTVSGDPAKLTPAPAYAVVVENLDDSGNPIAGEVVTLTSALQIVMPQFTGEHETDFTRTIRALLQLMKRQLLVAVDFAVQTDYDPTAGDQYHLAQFASFPAAAFIGPELEENRLYSTNEEPDPTVSGDGDADFVTTRVPFTVDVKFDIVFASDNKVELLNMMANTVAFFHKNKWLYVDKNATDPSLGQTRFELDFTENGWPKKIGPSNNSNVHTFTCSIVIRGFDVTDLQGLVIGSDSGVDNQAIVGIGKTATEISIAPAKQGV